MPPNLDPRAVMSAQYAAPHSQAFLQLHTQMQTLEKNLRRSDAMLRELLWSQVFRDSIADCTWLPSKAFSPGRWVAGYPLLYALFRTLSDAAPRRILELGMGQTTRMIGQYAAHHVGCAHVVVEHDDDWIAFFFRNFSLSSQSTLLRMKLTRTAALEAQESCAIPAYEDFGRRLHGQVFDLILIDGPYGAAEAGVASRVDVLDLLPGCLAPSFAILLDDTHRSGEQKTVEMIKAHLTASGIAHKAAVYRGEKDCTLIASADQRFLCSL